MICRDYRPAPIRELVSVGLAWSGRAAAASSGSTFPEPGVVSEPVFTGRYRRRGERAGEKMSAGRCAVPGAKLSFLTFRIFNLTFYGTKAADSVLSAAFTSSR